MKRIVLLSGLTCILNLGMHGQNPCGTTESYNDILNKHPEIRAAREASDLEASEIDRILNAQGYRKSNSSSTGNKKADNVLKAQGTIYYIPIVFHILHQGGPENITDAQIYSEMAQLNKDWSATTADTANTQTPWKGLEADVQIQFKLATIDPSGNCTNGITRHYDANTNWIQNTTPCQYTWDRTKYYNVYVVKTITIPSSTFTAAGYSSFPGTNGASNDVTVCLSNYIGNMGTSSPGNSHCLTHESGHFFNLYHIWDCCTSAATACGGSDQVGDTPETKGHNPGNCPSGTANQVCHAGIDENVNNYMDYSYCYTMFTAGQVTRMRNTIINNVGNVGRQNLASTANGIATGITTPQVCVPVANFHASTRTACPNTTITFSDSSSNAHVTSWQWSFPGGTMVGSSTVNDSMPKVSYASAGTYAVSYTASTSAGGNSITKNSLITINTNMAAHTGTFVEGMESATLPGPDWNVYCTGGSNWAVTSTAAATGAKSAMIDNFANTAGNASTLESASFNISGLVTPKFTFKVAYQQVASSDADKLQVYTSTDCGNSWTSRWSRTGSTLATVTPPSGFPLTPTPSQFTTQTVNINGVAGSTNVRFKFVFYADPAGQGNDIYLDDINIYDASAGVSTIETQVGLDIYPNPSKGNVHVAFSLSEKHNIGVSVTDMIGRTIESIPSRQYGEGEVKINIAEKTTYTAGVYLVHVNVDGQMISRKVVIE